MPSPAQKNTPDEWLRFISSLVRHAGRHRMHGQIEVVVSNGDVRQVRFVRSVIDAAEGLAELESVDPAALEVGDLERATIAPV